MSGSPHPRRRVGRVRAAARVGLAAAVGLVPLAVALGPATAAVPITPTVVNDPPRAPHSLVAFPARDFLSADGMTPGDTVVFEVTHSAARGGDTVASLPFVVGEDGLAEVNHPGGTCWDVVTPNIVAGDTVRVIVTDSPGGVRTGEADVTHVADVVATRPSSPAAGVVVVTGHARAEDGARLPVDQLDARLVAPGDTFARSGRRDLRLRDAGTLAYDDATGTAWTATWTGLSADDVTLALGAESMGSWLGRDPAAGNEGTVYETGAGIVNGPQPPCTAPRERLTPLPGEDAEAPSTPTGLGAAVSGLNTVTLTWGEATDNVGVVDYGVYRNGVPVFTVQRPDGAAPAPTTFVDRNVPPGSYSYTVDAGDAVGNRSGESAAATATAQAQPAQDVPVSNPPTHPFTIFPSRDMIDVEGLEPGQEARVEVIRAGRVVTDATGLIPDATGLVEINHVGTYCWAGTTPDLRANDRVRATVYDTAGSVVWVDEATVANVTARKAVVEDGVLTVHGTAAGHDGRPLPVGQLEQRLVSSSKEPFGANGKRTLRADASGQAQGTLAYDPVGPGNPLGLNWTATYPGLDATDVRLGQQVESRVMWLGRDPLAGLELTIFEVGLADPPGPAGPDCVAPLEPIDTQAPSVPTVSASGRPADRAIEVTWAPSTDDTEVYGYRVLLDGEPVAAVGGDTTGYTLTDVAPGTHSVSVLAHDAASPHGAGATDADRLTAGMGNPYGNVSEPSSPVTVDLPDVQAPSTPGDLAVTNPVDTVDARLTFQPSTDDSGEAPGYRVYRDGQLVAGAAPQAGPDGSLTWTDTGLEQGGTYEYAVEAVDAAGNVSARTDAVPVTIARDTDAPVLTGDPVVTVPDLHGRDVRIAWDAATDNIGVTGYGVYRDGQRIVQLGANARSYTDRSLPAGTYRYTVDAVDSAGNRSDRSGQTPGVAAVANDGPANGHTVIGYPARDFAEGDGYAGAGPVTVEVFRGGQVVARAHTTPDATGLVEVNHAGPGCWGSAGYPNTPDLRPGDVIRITPDATGVPDQTTVAGVRIGRPIQTAAGTVVVRGRAVDAAGARLPLDQLEARVITPGALFRLNGRRVLLAPGEGTLVYDSPTSASFTATFSGLEPTDVSRALRGEMVVNWLGRAPLVGNELTIAENGPGTDGGPAAGVCTAPLDPLAPLVGISVTGLDFGDQPAIPASTSAARPVVVTNAGAVALTVDEAYLGGEHPGDFTVAGPTLPATLAPGASLTLQVRFSPKAVGPRSATLNLVDDAANTTYQTVTLTGSGVDAAAPSRVSDLARSLVDNATVTDAGSPVRLTWAASTGRVTRYQVQRSIAGGAFTDVPAAEQPTAAVFDGTGALVSPAATATTVTTGFGSATRYQVRSCNGSTCSAYTVLAAFTLAPFQENNGAITVRGTWARAPLAGAWGGQVRSNATAASSATLRTTGIGFQVVGTLGPDRGNAEVWIDGVRVGTVSLYAPTTTPARVVFTRTGLANATHRVELRVLGTRTAPSTGNRVDLDGFIALR